MFGELEKFLAEICAHPKLAALVAQPEWKVRFDNFELGMSWVYQAGTESVIALEVEDKVRDIVKSQRSLEARLVDLNAFVRSIEAKQFDFEVGHVGTTAALRGEIDIGVTE